MTRATEPATCGCPGPSNTISHTGMCPTCGVEGPDRERAVRDALASGDHKVAADLGREQGRAEAREEALQIARRELIDARVREEMATRTPQRDREAG